MEEKGLLPPSTQVPLLSVSRRRRQGRRNISFPFLLFRPPLIPFSYLTSLHIFQLSFLSPFRPLFSLPPYIGSGMKTRERTKRKGKFVPLGTHLNEKQSLLSPHLPTKLPCVKAIRYRNSIHCQLGFFLHCLRRRGGRTMAEAPSTNWPEPQSSASSRTVAETAREKRRWH